MPKLSDSQPQLSVSAERALSNPFLAQVHTNKHVADALQLMLEHITDHSVIQGMADYFIEVAKGGQGLSIADLRSVSGTGSGDARFGSAFLIATQKGPLHEGRRMLTAFIRRNPGLSLDAIDLFESIRQSAERRNQTTAVVEERRERVSDIVDSAPAPVNPDLETSQAETAEAQKPETRRPRSDATQVFRTDIARLTLEGSTAIQQPDAPSGQTEAADMLDAPFRSDLLTDRPPIRPISVKVFEKPEGVEPVRTISQPAVTPEEIKLKAEKNTYLALKAVIHGRGDVPYETVEEWDEPILDVSLKSNYSAAVTDLYTAYGETELPEGFEHFKLVVRTRSGDFCLAMGTGKDRGTCKILKYYGEVSSR